MKYLKASFLVLALLACGQAVALPADHPANPEMAVPVFQPADYFAGQSGNVKLAADEHQHDAAPAAQESGAKDEAAAKQHGEGEGKGKGCKRGEGMGCCCQCCCKCGGEKGDMKGMKKSGDADKKGSGMMDCDMMKMMNKKGMQQDGEKPVEEPGEQPATKQEEGHESHH
jgi:hypothetical protein